MAFMAIKTALISVSDKRGVVEFARALHEAGVRILSTGGTAQHLIDAGIPVVPVQDVTGFPEILGGRVKSLHPKIHGGILARRDLNSDMAELEAHGIDTIDLVAVNLYPFRETIAKSGVTVADAMENTDIGGPAMVRAAAKNHAHVTVVVNPDRYEQIAAIVARGDEVPAELRRRLAAEAFGHTAVYDAAIAAYLRDQLVASRGGETVAAEGEAAEVGVGGASADAGVGVESEAAEEASPFPQELSLPFEKIQDLRYGENPHQKAAFYRDAVSSGGASIPGALLLHGKPLSFNNVNDAAAALDIAREFSDSPVAVAVKHTNPCGVGTGGSLFEAYQRAYEADPISIFGGIVALNREVDAETAQEMSKTFLEVIIAPSFSDEALAILQQKPSLRLLAVGPLDAGSGQKQWDIKRVRGGLLVQEIDDIVEDPKQWRVVTETAPTDAELEDLWFGWRVVKHVKSNAIVLAKDGMTIGVGAGQMNRILPTRMAIEQAGDRAKGAILASDAFFPFDDVVKAAAAAGIRAIVQPGGAKRDQDSIDAANAAGIAMVFTGIRHFKH